MDSLNLETIIGIILLTVFLCVAILFGGGIIFLINLKNRRLRQAAQSWHSTTGRIIESRRAPRVYFQLGITEEEAQARIKSIKELNKLKLEDFVPDILSLFVEGPALLGEAGALVAGEIIEPHHGESQHPLEEWPLVIYEYQVDGIKYMSNRVSVEDKYGPTTDYPWFLKRFPKGATVTVYYNPKDPKESALER